MERQNKIELMITDQELSVIEEMATIKDISKEAVLRQSFRLYQLVFKGFYKLVPIGDECGGCAGE